MHVVVPRLLGAALLGGDTPQLRRLPEHLG